MMVQRIVLLVCVSGMLLNAVGAEEALKSGPQPGKELPGTFEPKNITGPNAGETTCIFCEYGEDTVAMVFAREVSPPLTQLIKRLDAVTVKHSKAGLHSCAILLNSEAGVANQLKQLANKENVRHTILRTYKPEGPKGYNLAKDADITVVVYSDRLVKANHTFRKGGLKDKDIETIVADVVKNLPGKK
jgi:hypothetical protein